MIRLVQLIRRKAGMTPAEFNRYWRDEHGPLVAYHQTRLDILRYVQTHREPAASDAEIQASSKRGGLESPYDGVAELWFTSEQALTAARAAAAGRRALEEIQGDESKFIDHAASPSWFAHEYPQVSTQRERIVAKPRTGILKVNFALRPRPGLTAAEAQRYWLTMHGPLVRSHAAARGVLCYQQVHRFVTPLADELRHAPAKNIDPYMGHAEAWFDTRIPLVGAEPAASEAAAINDERHFIDWPRSTLLFGKELVFIDRAWV